MLTFLSLLTTLCSAFFHTDMEGNSAGWTEYVYPSNETLYNWKDLG
jgi:hypothetical protein